ncbi:MAG: thioredoxin domain-containing protein [Planctomycetaceae bacterium]|nr:thioredoxin domain-containing protein [Planctomycetaceae bacterium]
MRVLFALLLLISQDDPGNEKKMEHKHTNRLAKEKSPYLLQHAHNPVDWYPWGPEAFAKSRKEDKPIFLSIGYSTCHWCHVMEHESFEDEDVAKFLNEHFVPIKVDREERPDVDQIYMAAVQAMNSQGGWPLSAWLTPDLKPFMGGTYFPKEDRFGRPGFITILKRIDELWKDKRKELNESADQVGDYLKKMSDVEAPGEVKLEAVFEKAYFQMERSYEPQHGGFSQQPKFPHSTTISYLLRHYVRTGEKKALEMAEKSLTEMSRGGIYDQLGGGFARYSTDGEWLVPHFEKMLYDNALLASCYLEAWQLTKKDLYARIVRETLDYVLRDMTSKEGGFYSAEDADSEKIEGKFYVWNPQQVVDVLGKDADRFMKAFDVTPRGNWEPHEESLPKKQSVLHVVEDGDFSDLKKKMFEARSKRVRPHLDDKVLTGWNALMISAMAQAGAVLEEPRYREAAVKAANFLLAAHRKDGKLLRTSRLGEAKLDGYLEDYSYLAAALLDLYEATFDATYFVEAKALVAKAIDLFWDDGAGGFFVTAKSHESLIARMREEYEGPHPSGNSVMTLTLLKLFDYTGDASYRDRADKVVRSFKSHLERYPMGHGWMMVALDYLRGPSKEIVISGPDPEPLLKVVRSRYLPNKVLALADGKAPIPVLEGRGPLQGKAAAYVCENMTCKRPVTTPAELEALLK